MLDFVKIVASDISTQKRKGVYEVYPDFITYKFNDLMIKGGNFYAFWDEARGYWNTDIYALGPVIDEMIKKKADELYESGAIIVKCKYFAEDKSGVSKQFKNYIKNLADKWHQLDSKVIFANDKVKKSDYATFSLPYSLEDGKMESYEELISTLYKPKERKKIEWAIGSIIAGDSVNIQKFYVLYGPPGSGKSTVLDIIQMLFDGYWKSFKSEELGNGNAAFSMEALKDNPLVSIDHEGKLDRINNNTVLNGIVSHDNLIVNVKFASKYQMKFNTTMFIGTNTPVNITDSKSGLTRRLIDIHTTDVHIPAARYYQLMNTIQFELGSIAKHCLEVYLHLGKSAYDKYVPKEMLEETNDMYNFVSENLLEWEEMKYVTLSATYSEYVKWCENGRVTPNSYKIFKAELKDYFENFYNRKYGCYSVYENIRTDKFGYTKEDEECSTSWLEMSEGIKSIFDKECKDCYAQYATEDEIPGRAWASVKTRLRELETDRLHYVKVPENHIVIDFDIKNERGEKDFVLNLRAASKFPKTYAELSKGGEGIHLHYIYTGDVSKLSSVYDADIEVKVFRGGASLRRKLTKCNDIPIASIGSGLPLREEKPMVDKKAIENERHLIVLVKKCLNKEHHGHTAPEVDFIKYLTDQAYATEGLTYDIRSMKPALVSFAMGSTNQAQKCFNTVSVMHLCSKDVEENEVLYSEKVGDNEWKEAPIVFFDVEVFPNLFVICWKIAGSDEVNAMINPTPKETEELFKYRLVGFNNKFYDNHIIYARAMGYSILELYRLSKRIISKETKNPGFSSAYNLSYTDILDYSKNKQGLKEWQIDLGIYHLENAHPWDEPVDEKYWGEIVDYCKNDVRATEAVWNATASDFKARQIFADLSGGSVNDSTNSLILRLIFGNEKHPKLVYTNLADGHQEEGR